MDYYEIKFKWNKCSSVFCCSVSDEDESSIVQGPILKNFLRSKFMDFYDKVKCLSLVSFFRLFLWLWVRPDNSRVKHLSDVPLYGRLLTLPINIRQGWKVLLVTNTLAC